MDMVLRGLTIDKMPLKDHMETVGHKEAKVSSRRPSATRSSKDILTIFAILS